MSVFVERHQAQKYHYIERNKFREFTVYSNIESTYLNSIDSCIRVSLYEERFGDC